LIGFTPSGTLINFATTNISTWEQICETSSKLITFLDTCGHPKYQHTTISGLTGHSPDYACLIIPATGGGINDVAREHLGIACALKVPVFTVITKIDIASPEDLTKTVGGLLTVLKSPGVRMLPMVIQDEDDVVVAVSSFITKRVIPIFLTSSVTGENLDQLTQFLHLVPKPTQDLSSRVEEPVDFQIGEVFTIQDVGYVVSGILDSGRVSLGPGSSKVEYWIGPDKGNFVKVIVMSIHRHRRPVNSVKAGQAASFSIFFPNNEVVIGSSNGVFGSGGAKTPPPTNNARFKLRKGQVLLSMTDRNIAPSGFSEFEAVMTVLWSSGEIGMSTEGTIVCGAVRGVARVISVRESEEGKEPKDESIGNLTLNQRRTSIPTGETGIFRFKFLGEEEWLRLGATVLFRSERMRCVGHVARVGLLGHCTVKELSR